MALIVVRILDTKLRKAAVGTHSHPDGEGVEADSSCKVETSNHCIRVKERWLCGAKVIFYFSFVNQAWQLHKVGSHTIKYFTMISTNELILVQFIFHYRRFDVLSVE